LWFHGILARGANHTYLRNTRVFLNTHVARLTLRRQPLLAALVSDHRFEGRSRCHRRGARSALSHVSASCLRGRALRQRLFSQGRLVLVHQWLVSGPYEMSGCRTWIGHHVEGRGPRCPGPGTGTSWSLLHAQYNVLLVRRHLSPVVIDVQCPVH